MRSRQRLFLVAFFSGSCAAALIGGSEESASETGVIAFLHAAVVPMDEERVLRDQTIVVSNGEIVALGPAAEIEIPDGALRVEAQGKYLLPALCDMHVHLLSEAWNSMLPPEDQLEESAVPHESFLFPYVANGVTTVQAMSATPQELVLRERIERGELLGPRMVLARMIDGPGRAWPPPLSTWVDSATQAEEAVRHAEGEGYDKIKAYSFLSRESYDALVATARELELDVIGHIPMSLSVEYVLEAGQKLIAHSEEVLKHAGGDHSPARIDSYATKMAEHGVWLSPTLVTTRSILELFDDSKRVLGRPEAAFFRHPMERGVWNFIYENLYRPIPAETRAALREGFEEFQRPLTRVFHERGGKLLAGTDSLFPGLVPGFALQRELRELVEVGLTPFEALRTATSAPFEYLGESERAGTVALGKHSDLLLLDANPLEDVSATERIAGVLIRGRWIGAEEIQRTLGRLAESPLEASRAVPALPRSR